MAQGPGIMVTPELIRTYSWTYSWSPTIAAGQPGCMPPHGLASA